MHILGVFSSYNIIDNIRHIMIKMFLLLAYSRSCHKFHPPSKGKGVPKFSLDRCTNLFSDGLMLNKLYFKILIYFNKLKTFFWGNHQPIKQFGWYKSTQTWIEKRDTE